MILPDGLEIWRQILPPTSSPRQPGSEVLDSWHMGLLMLPEGRQLPSCYKIKLTSHLSSHQLIWISRDAVQCQRVTSLFSANIHLLLCKCTTTLLWDIYCLCLDKRLCINFFLHHLAVMLYSGISSGEQNHELLGSYTCLQALHRGGVLLHIAKAKQAHLCWQRQRWFGRWKQEPMGSRVLPNLLLTLTSAAAMEPYPPLSKPYFQHWSWTLMSKHFVKSHSFLDVYIILKSRMQTTKVLHWCMEQ